MGLVRLAVLGGLAYGGYRLLTQPRALAPRNRTHDGLAALYATREEADLAIERLVQEYGVNRSVVFTEPVENANTAGTRISGGDAPSGDTGSTSRQDAPLHGAIRLTVSASPEELSLLRSALEQAGASKVVAV